MCRHLAYLGPPVSLARLVLAPAHGLYEQSWAPRRQTHGVVNADGFGLGWYPAGPEAGEAGEIGAGDAGDPARQPARYRRAVPIWTDQNLPELARAIRSRAVIAAVRSATAGTGQEETAAAPFRDGRFLLSHNGAIPDWIHLPTDLESARGADSGTGTALDPLDPADLLSLEARSDTALLWLLIYRELRRGLAPDRAVATVIRAVAEVRPTARLNLLLTDGKSIIATRYGDTLWYRTGPGSVLVASEPDDEEPAAWREVPEDTLLLATAAGVVHTTSLRASYAAAEK
jgi:ergothioneine biosynthesis protein EgtC